MANRIVFSGIQPTGNLHIGNYIGAIKQWVEGQSDGQNIFCIVDMHAITVEQDANVLRQNSLNMAALLLACGIDPEVSTLFIQSQNPDHANLGWILNCNVSMGEMNRMTQFKEKSEKKDFVSVGLFDYPALMAADILLYDTTEVPVGEDQKQHVELTRDIAQRFNGRFGETFVLPKAVIPKSGGRVMSLTDPDKKMSKSDSQVFSRIELLDDADTIKLKVKKAVTGSSSSFDISNPGVKNLVELYSNISEKRVEEIAKDFGDKGYQEIKEIIAEEIVLALEPIQKRYQELQGSEELKEILNKGAEKARAISNKKLKEVYDKVGFVS